MSRSGLLHVGILIIFVTGTANISVAIAGERSPIVDRILAAAEQRTQRYSAIYAEYKFREQRSNGYDAPISLARDINLAFNGQKWRMNWVGQIMSSRSEGAPPVPRQQNSVVFNRAGAVQKYYFYDGKPDTARAQIDHLKEQVPGQFDSPDGAPVVCFTRFALSQFYPRLVAGEFVVSDEQPEQAWLVALRRQNTKTELWFDTAHDYVLVRQFIGGLGDLKIEYTHHPEIGYAPASWTSENLSAASGLGIRIAVNDVKWHQRLQEIESLLNFEFPTGTKVVDTGTPTQK